jgi:hypothetical protein
MGHTAGFEWQTHPGAIFEAYYSNEHLDLSSSWPRCFRIELDQSRYRSTAFIFYPFGKTSA